MTKRSGGEAVDPTETEATAEQPASKLAVRIGPALARGVTTVTKTDITLVAAVGELDDEQRVLVPFLQCAAYGSSDATEPSWTGSLALDNVAFLLEQLAVGLAESLDPLASMALGDVRPLPARLEYAADRVASAGESLREAAIRLREIANQKV